jgi:hypothetical protein
MVRQLVRRLSPRSRRMLQVGLSFALVIGIFVVVFRRIDVSAVWAQIEQMTWVELGTITAIALWNFVTYWLLWVAVLPGLTLRQAMVVTESGTAVTNTVPGGSAVGVGLAYAMFDSWGLFACEQHACSARYWGLEHLDQVCAARFGAGTRSAPKRRDTAASRRGFGRHRASGNRSRTVRPHLSQRTRCVSPRRACVPNCHPVSHDHSPSCHVSLGSALRRLPRSFAASAP